MTRKNSVSGLILSPSLTHVALVYQPVKKYMRRDGKPATGNFWSFPNGGVNEDEDPALAARREVYEETGLDLSDEILHPAYSFIKRDPKADLSLETRVYACMLDDMPHLTASRDPDRQILRARWMECGDAMTRIAGNPDARVRDISLRALETARAMLQKRELIEASGVSLAGHLRCSA